MSGADRYLVILVRADTDRFGHNLWFANELRPAIEAVGLGCRLLDYRKQAPAVLSALSDPRCRGFICFNGFGSEMVTVTAVAGELRSVFEYFNKPLFDFMHDSPAHEAMAHQVGATFEERLVLSTDYDYTAIAKSLGVRNVFHVPSITHPVTYAAIRSTARDIPILFALGLADPRLFAERLEGATIRGRVYRQLFDNAVDHAVNDWRRDPAVAVQDVYRDVGMPFDWRNADCRFLTSLVGDYVKFKRRRAMLDTLAGLPVTVVTDRDIGDARFEIRRQVSAVELLALMGASGIVVCPTTHFSGFHERPLAAMTAGAAVLSAPNGPLESHFMHGRDILFCTDAVSLRREAEMLLEDEERRLALSEAGQKRAIALFPPSRFVETIISIAQARLKLPLVD